jgi:hypothetical protein
MLTKLKSELKCGENISTKNWVKFGAFEKEKGIIL